MPASSTFGALAAVFFGGVATHPVTRATTATMAKRRASGIDSFRRRTAARYRLTDAAATATPNASLQSPHHRRKVRMSEILIGKGDKPVYLLAQYANRHG